VSLVPALAVLVLALATKRTFEALLGGTLVGYALTSGWGFFSAFTDSLLAVMKDETVGWITLVVGLFGALIALLVRSGGTLAFGEKVAAFAKGKRGALVVTWFMGLAIFLDDYLNALAVGSSMQRVTDRFRVSREKLAYFVDSTAAPVCVLVPLSTWAFYVAGLFEGVGAAPTGEGLALYRSVIPYLIYPWIAVLLVPLVAIGLIPDLGPMRRAEERAGSGDVAPPGSPSFDETFGAKTPPSKPRLVNFLVPLSVLVGVSWYLNDALKGVLVAVAFTIALLAIQRLLSFREISETFFLGFQSMVYPLAIVVMSFGLRNVNEDLGLTLYVIESVKPIMSATLLPAVAFVTLSLIAFATGSFWGVYAVSLPIIVPLAQSMDVSLPLALGAVVSAGAFGSHACFYGDATVLSASASGCEIHAHVMTQLPYVLVAAAISTLLYVVLGAAL
jgi:Na+/H+ antiporter NhaC